MPRQMNSDTALHNSKEFCQIHFLSFELQIGELSANTHKLSTGKKEHTLSLRSG